MEKMENVEKLNDKEKGNSSEFLKKFIKRALLVSGIALASLTTEAQNKDTTTYNLSPETRTEIENKSLTVDSLADVLMENAIKKNICEIKVDSGRSDFKTIFYIYHPVSGGDPKFAIYEDKDKITSGGLCDRKEIYFDDKRFLIATNSVEKQEERDLFKANNFLTKNNKQLNISGMIPCKEIPFPNVCSFDLEKVVFMQFADRKGLRLSLEESKNNMEYTTENFLKNLDDLSEKLKEEIEILEK